MDDGLAERLFDAFWKPIVEAGYPWQRAYAELILRVEDIAPALREPEDAR